MHRRTAATNLAVCTVKPPGSNRILRILSLGLLVHSGCIHIFCEPEVVRRGEVLLPMRAESKEVLEVFQERATREVLLVRYVSEVTFPFFVYHSKAYRKSKTAHLNDQMIKCDRNGDGMITRDEAEAYALSEPEVPINRVLSRGEIDAAVDE